MKLDIHNDGKEKRHSFEVSIEMNGMGLDSYIDFSANSWGASEEEAISLLKQCLVKASEEIAKIEIDKLEKQYVDCTGIPLKT